MQDIIPLLRLKLDFFQGMIDNVYVCRGTRRVEKVEPDPLNLSVNTVVGSNHFEIYEAVFAASLFYIATMSVGDI